MVLCPVCGSFLTCGEKMWNCENGHAFDVARQGYVNLLTVDRKHSLHPGDTKEMVAARKAFLDGGHYAPIAKALGEILEKENPKTILDVGCGEGYYLTSAAPKESRVWGIDISKDAVRYAAVRNKNAAWLVATASHLPFADGSFSCLTSMFSLTEAEEFRRVLQKDGLFVRVTAHPGHLMGLKNIIYPEIIHKEKELMPEYDGFVLEACRELSFDFTIHSKEMIQNLLSMTPHFWRIGKDGAARLNEKDTLTDTARVLFHLYRAV